MINRRSLITGLISLVAAPSIVKVQNIMPVKSFNAEVELAKWLYQYTYNPNISGTAIREMLTYGIAFVNVTDCEFLKKI